MKMRGVGRGRRLVRLVGLLLTIPVCWIGWNQATHNFAVVQPGRVFRSGQMPAWALTRTIHDHHIRTVLNLRGPNPDQEWYRTERAATLDAGATQVDISLSSCIWMSRVQLRTLIRVFDECQYPFLIHCAWGSERTGLVSAFAELSRPGGTLADGRAQFTIQRLFVPFGDGKIMAEALDQYEGWLAAEGVGHSPQEFRRWAAHGYRPMKPSREDWPWDPYPLVVITRPGEPRTASGAGFAGSTAGKSQEAATR